MAWWVFVRRTVLALCVLAGVLLGCVAFPEPSLAQAGVGTSSTVLPASIPVLREKEEGNSTQRAGIWWAVFATSAALLVGIVCVIKARARARAAEDIPRRPVAQRSLFGRFRDPRGSADLRKVSSMRLTPGHTLHVVEWDGRRMLVGCSQGVFQLLTEAPDGRGSFATGCNRLHEDAR